MKCKILIKNESLHDVLSLLLQRIVLNKMTITEVFNSQDGEEYCQCWVDSQMDTNLQYRRIFQIANLRRGKIMLGIIMPQNY